MKVLVANIGSTSFKYRLFDLITDQQMARGGIDRIGREQSQCTIEVGARREELTAHVRDHADAVRICFDQLTHPDTGCLNSMGDVSAIGFKAVFAAELSGVRLVDDELLTRMEELADVAPAHNPPYVQSMRQLQEAFPDIPMVAALETGFHESIAPENRGYAVPYQWQEQYGIQRWGFHGASHRYVAQRTATVVGNEKLRVISCHLGGSSSLCAIREGQSMANSLGMSPQSGVPHNNRVGEFDPFALPVLMRATGRSLEELLEDLASRSGLLGMSGVSGDVRDLEEAAHRGDSRAQNALNTFVASIRHYLGAYLTVLNGCDVIVFTGGIGENSRRIRESVCRNLDWAGIRLDRDRNKNADGETRISAENSNVEIWVLPTNEELIVAHQTAEVMKHLDQKSKL